MTPKQNQCLIALHDTLTQARKDAKDVRGAAIGNHDLTNTMLQMDAFLTVLQRVIDDYYLRDKSDLNLKADPNEQPLEANLNMDVQFKAAFEKQDENTYLRIAGRINQQDWSYIAFVGGGDTMNYIIEGVHEVLNPINISLQIVEDLDASIKQDADPNG